MKPSNTPYGPAGRGTDRTYGTSSRYRAATLRARTAVLGLGALALLVGACGGAPKSPEVAGAGGPKGSAAAGAASTSTTGTTVVASGSSGPSSSAQSRQSVLLEFSQCMRSHGVPNFPDLSATAGILNGLAHSGVNPGTAAFRSALQACKKYNTAGGVTPAQSAAETAKLIRFSQCMRSHGVPNYPDPTIGPLGEQVMDLRGIDLTSPTFQAASKACQKIVPGGGSK